MLENVSNDLNGLKEFSVTSARKGVIGSDGSEKYFIFDELKK